MSKTILVVDDLATQRAAVSYTLGGAGYQVVQAEDGEDALAQLKEANGIHLVISDLKMPKMDGLRLLQTLKQDPQYQRIPVLILLNESQIDRKEELRKAGAAGWIIKPFQPEQLCTVVSKLVP